eukprot:9481779-Pyramimonas_sp.AAC.1
MAASLEPIGMRGSACNGRCAYAGAFIQIDLWILPCSHDTNPSPLPTWRNRLRTVVDLSADVAVYKLYTDT